MALIDSDLLEADELETEDVTVAALGGEVRVRSFDLVERLTFESRVAEVRKKAAADGVTVENPWLPLVPEVLEICVLDVNGRPVKSAARWRKWGAKHLSVSVHMFNTVWRLSGMSSGVDAEKKT